MEISCWSSTEPTEDVFEVVTEASIFEISSSVDVCRASVIRAGVGRTAGEGGGGQDGSSSEIDIVAIRLAGSGDAASTCSRTSSALLSTLAVSHRAASGSPGSTCSDRSKPRWSEPVRLLQEERWGN